MPIGELNPSYPNPNQELQITVTGNPVFVAGWGNIISQTQDSLEFVPSGYPADNVVLYGHGNPTNPWSANLQLANSRLVRGSLNFSMDYWYQGRIIELDFAIYNAASYNGNSPWTFNTPLTGSWTPYMEGQVVFADARRHPINELTIATTTTMPDYDGGLAIVSTWNYPTTGSAFTSVPITWMSTPVTSSVTAFLTINTSGGVSLSTDGNINSGGTTFIFLTSAYVNPSASLAPNQLLSQSRQQWTG